MQNVWEIIGGNAHCTVLAGELFGGPYRSPFEGTFLECRVFALTDALFVGSKVFRLWLEEARRRNFTYREGEILSLAEVL